MYFRITEIILNRQRSPWFWPDVLFNTLGQGQEHDKLLKILHVFILLDTYKTAMKSTVP
jgi:cytochrome P450 family 4 subfamily V